MRVLFIGGTGNISAACAAMAHRGGRHEVAVVSRGRGAVPKEYLALTADRKDPGEMRAAIRTFDPEVVLNFLGYDLSDVQLDYELFSGRLRQYVFISSATVYAKPASLPITEESPLGNQYWDYAQKKLVCEHWLMERWREQRFPVTVVRPSHTYSERWVPNPVSSSSYTFCTRLEQGKPIFVPDNGDNPWTLTSATDFAAGLAGLIGNNAAVGQAFHVTSDEVLTWNQIVAEIAEGLGVHAARIARIPTDFICQIAPQMTGTLKGDKAQPGIFDNSKIKRFVPGFRCGKPFRVGVRESIAWLRAHPDRQNLNPAVDELCEKVVAGWETSTR